MHSLGEFENTCLTFKKPNKALRGKKQRKNKTEKINNNSINEVVSKEKKVSQHKLKSEIVNPIRFEKLFTKTQMIQIGKLMVLI